MIELNQGQPSLISPLLLQSWKMHPNEFIYLKIIFVEIDYQKIVQPLAVLFGSSFR